MVERKVSIVDTRKSTARGTWKSPEQREKAAERKSRRLNKANRLGRRGERDRGSERGDKDRRRPRGRGPREHIAKIVGL